jgi:hypothetical protein
VFCIARRTSAPHLPKSPPIYGEDAGLTSDTLIRGRLAKQSDTLPPLMQPIRPPTDKLSLPEGLDVILQFSSAVSLSARTQQFETAAYLI